MEYLNNIKEVPGCPWSKSSFLEAFLFSLVVTTSSVNHLQAIKLCFSWLMLPGHWVSPGQRGMLSGAGLTAAHTFALPCSWATWQLCKTYDERASLDCSRWSKVPTSLTLSIRPREAPAALPSESLSSPDLGVLTLTCPLCYTTT